LHGRRLGLGHRLRRLRRSLLDTGGLTVLGRRRGRFLRSGSLTIGSTTGRSWRLPGTVCGCCSLSCLACEFVFEPANYRRLDSRGRGPDKLTHFLELGHHGLALDAELLSELVYPDLRHCAPLLGPDLPGLSAGRGEACSVRRQFVLFIAACSSGAHHNSAFFPLAQPMPAARRTGSP